MTSREWDQLGYAHCDFLLALNARRATNMFAHREELLYEINIDVLVRRKVALSAVSCAKAQDKAAPAGAQTQRPNSLQGASDWRERMQNNHNADSSTEQQVRRLTADLALTRVQQDQVRQLSREHNDGIQKILDTAPPALTYEDFQTQVHAISQQFHDSVNAILTPRQLELMKAMVGRLDSGTEARHAP